MEKQTVIILIAVVYLLACLAVGLYFSRRQKTLENYYIAGKSLGPLVTAMAVAASYVSGWTFIGAAGVGYSAGLVLLSERVLVLGQSIFPWVFFARKLRVLANTHNCLTIPDALFARYQSRAVSVLGAVGIFFGLIGYTATQLLALGTMMAVVFKISFPMALTLGVVILGLYSVMGGIEGAIWVDVLQGAIMISASLYLFFASYALIGGPGEAYQAMQAIDPRLVTFEGKWGWPFLFSFVLASMSGFVMPQVITKYYMIRRIKLMKNSAVYNQVMVQMMAIIGLGVPFAYLTLQYRGLVPKLSNPDDVTPVFVITFMPSPVAGVLFAGVLAAIMSTASSFLNLGSSVFVRDILQVGLRKQLKNEILFARFGTVVFLGLAIALAFTAKTMVLLLGAASVAVFGATLVPSLFIGLWWKRATSQGAIAAMIVGLLISVGVQALSMYNIWKLPYDMLPGGIGTVLATLVMIVVSLLTQQKEMSADEAMTKVIEMPLVYRAQATGGAAVETKPVKVED